MKNGLKQHGEAYPLLDSGKDMAILVMIDDHIQVTAGIDHHHLLPVRKRKATELALTNAEGGNAMLHRNGGINSTHLEVVHQVQIKREIRRNSGRIKSHGLIRGHGIENTKSQRNQITVNMMVGSIIKRGMGQLIQIENIKDLH